MLVWDIFWFPIGIIVDAVTGAWYRLEPAPVHVTLTKLNASIDGPDQIKVWLTKTLNENQAQIMSTIPVNFRVAKAE